MAYHEIEKQQTVNSKVHPKKRKDDWESISFYKSQLSLS